MLFGSRIYELMQVIEDHQDYDTSINKYGEASERDLERLYTFFTSVWKQDYFSREVGIKISSFQLDADDYSFSCKITKGGTVIISIGTVIAIDGFSSLISSSSFEDNEFVDNDFFTYFNERFPLFSDYSFLMNIKNHEIKSGAYKGVLQACIPKLPTDIKALNHWKLVSNMMLGYLVMHELGHIQLSHIEFLSSNNASNDLSKICELEADVYSATRLFIDFFRPDFHAQVQEVLEDENILFYFLTTIILSAHGLLLGANYSEISALMTPSNKYPSEECRIINVLCGIHSATATCNSLNEIIKDQMCYEISNEMQTYIMSFSIRHTDFALRIGGRHPILPYPCTAEIVIDPNGQYHTRFVVHQEKITSSDIDRLVSEMLQHWWIWLNQGNPHKPSEPRHESFEEWQSLIFNGKSQRFDYWRNHSATTVENFQKDHVITSVCRFFLGNLDNIKYFSSNIDVNLLKKEAKFLIESIGLGQE